MKKEVSSKMRSKTGKRIRGHKTEAYCDKVTKLTMSLRLNLLKSLMLKTPAESHGLGIHLCLREGNLLHYFILSTCNGSNHWSYWKKAKSWLVKSVNAAVAMESMNKKVCSWKRFSYLVSRNKVFNSIVHLQWRSYEWPNIGSMLFVAILPLHVRALSLSVGPPSRADDPCNIPEKRSYQGVLHLNLISSLRDWKKETQENREEHTSKLPPTGTQGLDSADMQKSESGWIHTTKWNKELDPCINFTCFYHFFKKIASEYVQDDIIVH